MSRFTFRTAAAAVLTAGLALAGCATAPAETDPSALPTFTEGKLTIATGEPAYPPYVLDDAPESGKGFEAAIAYAVAEELGFAKEDVVWVRASWDATIAPGAKPYDFNLQQVSILDERKTAVDFAGPYFEVPQTVITLESSPAAGAASVADLQGVRIGAASGTTSLTAIETVIQPTTAASVFPSNDEAKLALQNGQIDALVVDLWTAFYIAGAELDGGKVIGQLAGTATDGWGLVLEKDSALTAPVQAALDALKADGTLEAIAAEWLAGGTGVAVLQ